MGIAMSEEMHCAVGRRKTSVARVRLGPGAGEIKINKKTLDKYFARESLKCALKKPLEITETLNKLNVYVNVSGGGLTGQADAIRHGIARALLGMDVSLRGVLKKAGFLTRDPRMKERKKYGQKGARARFQFSKR